MGFFDSTSVTSNPTVVPSLSGTVNAFGPGFNAQTAITPVFSAGSSGNYAPAYSFTTQSNPVVNANTNLSLQLASNSPGSTFSNSQTASSSSLWQILLAIGAVLLFFYFYHRHK